MPEPGDVDDDAPFDDAPFDDAPRDLDDYPTLDVTGHHYVVVDHIDRPIVIVNHDAATVRGLRAQHGGGAVDFDDDIGRTHYYGDGCDDDHGHDVPLIHLLDDTAPDWVDDFYDGCPDDDPAADVHLRRGGDGLRP